jgi:hypothetical protein
MAKIKIYTEDQLLEKTVAELREMCKKFNIIGMSKAKKDELIEVLIAFYDDQVDSSYQTEPESESQEKVPYVNAHIHSFLGSTNDVYQSLITVSCGAANGNYPLVGKSVGFVKATYREIMNIDDTANAVVNGNEESESYVLKTGDTVEFIRKAGSKG